jgi:DivIVA domain-containing protein
MDISPQRVRTAEFRTIKKGLDPDEVRTFLAEVANELERAQNQSTAMEARARAAVARLQEISEATPPAPEPAPQPAPVETPSPSPSAEVTPSIDQAETISRTLLLAQRTADTAIAEAEAEARRITATADEEANRTLESTREMSARLLDEARDEARRTGEAERIRVESEVNALLARRDFLESDVDHLQTFLVDERSRLRDAATSIMDLVERVPGGLGEVRRPLLSASDDLGTSSPASGASGTMHTSADAHTEEMPLVGRDGAETPRGIESADAAPLVDDERDDPLDDDHDDHDDAPAEQPMPGVVDTGQLIIQTDISDDGPTGFSYDDGR